MTTVRDEVPSSRRSLRLWPGVVIVTLQWLTRFGLPLVMPDAVPVAMIGGIVGGLGVVVWWVFFSRAPWSERLGAVGLMIAAMFATQPITHESIAKGAMGMLFAVLAIPLLSLAFVAWAVASRHLSDGPRRAAMVGTIFVACGVWALVRTGGITGNFDNDLQWRWAKTPEERLLAQPVAEPAVATIPEKQEAIIPRDQPVSIPTAPVPSRVETVADWPSFRGRDRDSIVRGVRIKTDWSASPPVELWPVRSDRAGRPLPFAVTFSIPRSSAALTKLSPATERLRARRCGRIATQLVSGNRMQARVRGRHRHLAMDASTRLEPPEF